MAQRRQAAIGLALAAAILAAWLAVHVYAMFFFDLTWDALPLAFVPALLLAAVQCWLSVGLFIVSHDAMHGSLVPGAKRINSAIGAGLLAVASFAWPRVALVFILIAITALIATAAIGVFHVGVEYRWWAGPQACSGNIPTGLSAEQLKKYLFGAKMVRCDQTAWSMWGISMAGWNAILSAALAFVLSSGVAHWVRSRT